MSRLGSDQACGVAAMGSAGLPVVNGCFRLILHVQRGESVRSQSAHCARNGCVDVLGPQPPFCAWHALRCGNPEPVI
jgi:hypothetical protein